MRTANIRLVPFAVYGPLWLLAIGLTWVATSALAQDAADQPEASVGQFLPAVREPIRQDDIEELETAVQTLLTRSAALGQRPILVFEFQPGPAGSGGSSFGAATDLADFIANSTRGAGKTVAFVPESLAGFILLPVLACDEIVVGPEASLGPIMPGGEPAGVREQAVVRDLARTKGRSADLLLGLLDPSLDLREVRTVDGTQYVLRENLDDFRTRNQVIEERPAWQGRAGVLTADGARRTVARLQAASREEVAQAYGLPSTAVDPTLLQVPNAALLSLKGPITPLNESYLKRQLARLPGEGVNLLVLQIDSEGGTFTEANTLATALLGLEGIKTIAYIDDRALGVSALVPLACDQIVFRDGARMGDVTVQLFGPEAEREPLDDRMRQTLADRAEDIAGAKGHSIALARAMVDPEAIVHLARDTRSGAVIYVLDRDVIAEPDRYEVLETPKSSDGEVLVLTDRQARDFRFADEVVDDLPQLLGRLGVSRDQLQEAHRTWVDGLIDTLNQPWMKAFLLFVGIFMLILELKLPGIGLPAILSVLSFVLFFWSQFMGGTADLLEILLFVMGVACLLLELFVFPGFGVFGFSGVLMVLASLVMASHTFVWPSQPYEYRLMAWSLTRVLGSLIGVILAVVALGKVFPSLPFYKRVVLQPEPYVPDLAQGVKPTLEGDQELGFLLGEVGHATTVLRPSGKARFPQFGDLLVDVTADGYFIDAQVPIEVVEVVGHRVVVKPA